MPDRKDYIFRKYLQKYIFKYLLIKKEKKLDVLIRLWVTDTNHLQTDET